RRICFFFSSRRRHTRSTRDWSSDVCSSDLKPRHARPNLAVGFLVQRGRPPSLQTKCRRREKCHPKSDIEEKCARASNPEPPPRTALLPRHWLRRRKTTVCSVEADGAETLPA